MKRVEYIQFKKFRLTLFQVSSLIRNVEYIFRVRARNKFGLGDILESDPVKAVDFCVVAGPPRCVSLCDIEDGCCTLTWERPVECGGCDILGE